MEKSSLLPFVVLATPFQLETHRVHPPLGTESTLFHNATEMSRPTHASVCPLGPFSPPPSPHQDVAPVPAAIPVELPHCLCGLHCESHCSSLPLPPNTVPPSEQPVRGLRPPSFSLNVPFTAGVSEPCPQTCLAALLFFSWGRLCSAPGCSGFLETVWVVGFGVGGVDPSDLHPGGGEAPIFPTRSKFSFGAVGAPPGGGDTPPHTEVQVTDFWPGTKRQAERPHPQPTPNSKKQLLPYLRSEF